jgi:hypothetical protein
MKIPPKIIRKWRKRKEHGRDKRGSRKSQSKDSNLDAPRIKRG